MTSKLQVRGSANPNRLPPLDELWRDLEMAAAILRTSIPAKRRPGTLPAIANVTYIRNLQACRIGCFSLRIRNFLLSARKAGDRKSAILTFQLARFERETSKA